MILDIRGTNGSGKSYIVHHILKKFECVPIIDKCDGSNKVIIGYWCENLQLAIVGRYTTECGGCDTIKTAQGIEDRLRDFAERYPNVLLEGLMVSHTFGRYNKIARDIGNYYFLFLTTSLSKCIARIKGRRYRKGNRKPYDPYKKHAVVDDYAKVLSAKQSLIKEGRNVIELNWRNPITQVLEYLE